MALVLRNFIKISALKKQEADLKKPSCCLDGQSWENDRYQNLTKQIFMSLCIQQVEK